MLQGRGAAGTLMYHYYPNTNLTQVGGGAGERSSWNCHSCIETLITVNSTPSVCMGGGGVGGGGGTGSCTSSLVYYH